MFSSSLACEHNEWNDFRKLNVHSIQAGLCSEMMEEADLQYSAGTGNPETCYSHNHSGNFYRRRIQLRITTEDLSDEANRGIQFVLSIQHTFHLNTFWYTAQRCRGHRGIYWHRPDRSQQALQHRGCRCCRQTQPVSSHSPEATNTGFRNVHLFKTSRFKRTIFLI